MGKILFRISGVLVLLFAISILIVQFLFKFSIAKILELFLPYGLAVTLNIIVFIIILGVAIYLILSKKVNMWKNVGAIIIVGGLAIALLSLPTLTLLCKNRTCEAHGFTIVMSLSILLGIIIFGIGLIVLLIGAFRKSNDIQKQYQQKSNSS